MTTRVKLAKLVECDKPYGTLIEISQMQIKDGLATICSCDGKLYSRVWLIDNKVVWYKIEEV